MYQVKGGVGVYQVKGHLTGMIGALVRAHGNATGDSVVRGALVPVC